MKTLGTKPNGIDRITTVADAVESPTHDAAAPLDKPTR